VPNSLIGMLSSSLFIGMMFGALFWGILLDIRGRKQAFKWTLAITTVFGIFSSLAQSFLQLCIMFFLLGFGVGGSMSVDGIKLFPFKKFLFVILFEIKPFVKFNLGVLLLEFIPKKHQYLLTFMSVFFSIGAVLSSISAYFIFPSHSCFEVSCDVSKKNNGWRYLLAFLGFLVSFNCSEDHLSIVNMIKKKNSLYNFSFLIFRHF
jgi:MFS family permease